MEQYCCPGYVGDPPSTSCVRMCIDPMHDKLYFFMTLLITVTIQLTVQKLVRMEVLVLHQMNVLALMIGLENTVKYVSLTLSWYNYKHVHIQKRYIKGDLLPTITAVCEPPCENGGHCVAPDVCSCLTEWKGDRCEQGILFMFILGCICTKTKYFTTAVCQPSCQNGGQCVRPNQCDCTEEWEGHICDEGKI